MSAEPIVNDPFLYINGMIGSWVSNTALSLSSGICRDSTNVYDIPITTAKTINASVNGLNGLDTGTFVASKVYVIYAIMDPSESPSRQNGYLLSLSLTAPTLPFGYGAYRIVGYWASDASAHFLLGYVSGATSNRTFTYDAVQATAITAGAATTYTDIDLSTLVPLADNIPVYLLADLLPGAAGRVLNLQPANGTGNSVTVTGQVTAVHITPQVKVLAQILAAKPQISYKVSNSGDAAAISVLGFDYYL